MREKTFIRVRRIAVPDEPLLHGSGHNYADAFELQLDRPDEHSAEQSVRTGLEQPLLRGLILLVHRRVLRFDLGPADAEHILGWRIITSEPDVLQLAVSGPLLRAAIVARRTSPTTLTATTFVSFERPPARQLWRVIGPLHRRVAPYVLKRAARTLATEPTSAYAA